MEVLLNFFEVVILANKPKTCFATGLFLNLLQVEQIVGGKKSALEVGAEGTGGVGLDDFQSTHGIPTLKAVHEIQMLPQAFR